MSLVMIFIIWYSSDIVLDTAHNVIPLYVSSSRDIINKRCQIPSQGQTPFSAVWSVLLFLLTVFMLFLLLLLFTPKLNHTWTILWSKLFQLRPSAFLVYIRLQYPMWPSCVICGIFGYYFKGSNDLVDLSSVQSHTDCFLWCCSLRKISSGHDKPWQTHRFGIYFVYLGLYFPTWH